jgi:hypothetical protein
LAIAAVGTAAHGGPGQRRGDVNHKPLVLPPRATGGEALLGSRTVPRNGVLLSAVTHSVVDPTWTPGRVLFDDRPARLDKRLGAGDRIRVTNGVDGVEGTVERDQMIQSPGGTLPDVEREVWTPGIDGVARAKVGERSGEVVQQDTMRPPVAASRVPGPVIALSFDDGPDPVFTPQVLRILANAGVKATFCVIGKEARAFRTCFEPSRNKATRSVTIRSRIRTSTACRRIRSTRSSRRRRSSYATPSASPRHSCAHRTVI